MLRRTGLLAVLLLGVPIYVVGDALVAWKNAEFGRIEAAALVAGGLWLVVAALIAAVTPLRRRVGPHLPQMALLVASTIGALLVVEFVIAPVVPDAADARVFPHVQGRRSTTTATPETMPGVDATARFTVNQRGLRGPAEPAAPGAYRIITIGGSATENLFLDDRQEWPRLLMDGLNRVGGSPPAWVANAGLSGHTAVHHLLMIERVEVLDDADAWILMPGINDFQSTLARAGAATQADLERAASRAMTGSGMTLARTRIGQRFRRAITAFRPAPPSGRQGEPWYGDNRAKRAGLPTLPMPDLTVGLAEYRDRIARLAAACRERGKRCLFLTQPTMWRDDLPPDLARLLWFGWIGPMHAPRGFVSIADLALGMRRYNDALLEVCRQAGMECLDLAAAIPKDTRAMFDDCHFNVSGARLVADVLVAYLGARPPFAGQGLRARLSRR